MLKVHLKREESICDHCMSHFNKKNGRLVCATHKTNID